MQKNKLVKYGNLCFLARLTMALAPADETVRRQIQKMPSDKQKANPNLAADSLVTARHLGSI